MIPVYVNVFNRLTTTRALCHQLTERGACVTIIDNASDWPPLLDWYSDCPYDVVWLKENLGQHAPWLCGVIAQDAVEVYGVTDCDLDLDGVPMDLFERLQSGLNRAGIMKAGVSLRIDDLPEWQWRVKEWESKFWRQRLSAEWYRAPIDTTLALYRGSTDHSTCMKVIGVPSIRSADPYTARHVPWYLDCEALDAENRHYFETANAANSWKPSGRGLDSRFRAH